MNPNTDRYRKFNIFKLRGLIYLLISWSLLSFLLPAQAHHPHDNIDALAISPDFKNDNTVYIASSGHIFKSRTGGRGWKELINGLDHTSTISSIVVSKPHPADNSTDLYLSTLADGIYRSEDTGSSWERINIGLNEFGIASLSHGPGDSILAVSTSGRLYKTHNKGNGWRPADIPGARYISAAVFSSQENTAIALAGSKSGLLYISKDKGENWSSGSQLPVETQVTAIAIDPTDKTIATWFIGTEKNGIFRTKDGGSTFQSVGPEQLSNAQITSLSLSQQPGGQLIIVATTWNDAAYKSTDSGNSWKLFNDGLTTDEQATTAKYRSPQFSDIAIADDSGQVLFIAGFDGLFKSTDGGSAWHELEVLPVGLIKGLAVSPVAEGNYSLAITTYGGGVYISQDEGQSWLIGNQGLNTTRLMSVQFTPSFKDDNTLFSGSNGYLLKSTNGGKSWEKIAQKYNPIRKQIANKLISFGLARDTADDLLLERYDRKPLYPTVVATSPEFLNDRTVLYGTRYHGLFQSEDAGHDGRIIWEHMDAAITSLSLSPNYVKDKTAFLNVRGEGLYRSFDAGSTWQKIHGLSFKTGGHDHRGTLIENKDFFVLFSPSYEDDNLIYAGGALGLYSSSDRGDTWSPMAGESLGEHPNILAIAITQETTSEQTMLISIKGRGLFKSDDNGRTFRETGKSLLNDNQSIEHIAFSNDYQNDRTVYAASDEILFHSENSGEDWRPLKRPVRYENHRGVIQYEGQWVDDRLDQFSASAIHYSTRNGDKASLDFVGCGVRWIAARSPEGGHARVYIDNGLVDTVSLLADKLEPIATVFTERKLSCGPHTISIEVANNPKSSTEQNRVMLDAFDVLPEE